MPAMVRFPEVTEQALVVLGPLFRLRRNGFDFASQATGGLNAWFAKLQI